MGVEVKLAARPGGVVLPGAVYLNAQRMPLQLTNNAPRYVEVFRPGEKEPFAWVPGHGYVTEFEQRRTGRRRWLFGRRMWRWELARPANA